MLPEAGPRHQEDEKDYQDYKKIRDWRVISERSAGLQRVRVESSTGLEL
jgi:hypothetical protein